MKRFLKYLLRRIVAVVFLIAILAGGVELYKEKQGNFHEVQKDKMYRSGQLSPKLLESYIKEKNIKTVLNLRGNSKEKWHNDELNVTRKYHVTYVDLALSAYGYYDVNQTTQFVRLLKRLPTPILVHCHGGADRSALIAALWRFSMAHETIQQALKAFNTWYGYLPYFKWVKKEYLRKSFKDYARANRK